MASIADMYSSFSAPNVSTRDFEAAQDRKNQRIQGRFDTGASMISTGAKMRLKQEYRSRSGRFAGLPEDDAFRMYYTALSAYSPDEAEAERVQYESKQKQQFGEDVAGAFAQGGRDSAIKAFMRRNPGEALQMTAPKAGSNYTPEQAQVVKAKEENRQLLNRAQASLNTAMASKDTAQATKWDAEVKRLMAEDARLNRELARLGVGGYAAAEQAAVAQTGTENQVPSEAVSLDINVDKRAEFMQRYANVKSMSDIPTVSQIIADAKAAGYSLSGTGAADIRKELESVVGGRRSDADYSRTVSTQNREENQRKYDDWLKTSLPGIEKAYIALNEARNGLESALSQASRSPAGGAYIAMKKVLGDALSNSDFAGIAGFGIDTGILGKIKASLGATSMNDSDANAILQQAVSGFNAMLNSYNSRFNDDRNPEFVNKAKKAFAIQPLSSGARQSSGSGESKLDKIRRLRAEREKMGAK